MDNYPDHLAPEFNKGGGVETPFNEWWARVSSSFPLMPEEVAREWLHRHWRHSPFAFLKSDQYQFSRVIWPSSMLCEIRWRWNNFKDDTSAAIEHGESISDARMQQFLPFVSKFMLANHTFPSPPIILDNRNGHLIDDIDPSYYPKCYLLVEGHLRFSVASYLYSIQKIEPKLPFWLMTRNSN
jgi:hypothetical protein